MDPLSERWLIGVRRRPGSWAASCSSFEAWAATGRTCASADIATSSIDAIAAGEVRVSGVVEPAELTLVSLLQSRQCVYYRATVGDAGERRRPDPGYTEERSIGFRVRDESGSLRVFPREARFDAPVRFEGQTGTLGDEPPGLDLRRGGSTRGAEIDRAVAAAELLRVHAPWEWTALAGVGDRDGRRSYRETRLEPGDEVTIVGWALPFSDLPDPAGANLGDGSGTTADDPEVEADLAAARASGQPRRRPGRGLGQCRDPRLRDRPPGDRAGHRPGGRSAAAGHAGRGGPDASDVRHRPGDARPRGGGRCPPADRVRDRRAPSSGAAARSSSWACSARSSRSCSAMVLAVELNGGFAP